MFALSEGGEGDVVTDTTPTMQDVVARLAAAERQLARYEAERAARQRARARTGRGGRRVAALALALFVALVPLSVIAVNPFTDLVPGSVHNGDIDLIYNAGITVGCVPNQEYCPTAPVTRQEMASLLARTAGLGSYPPVVNAKTAQTATNAAQLGDQPASYYAPAGQPIANATNAAQLGGLPASAYAQKGQFRALELVNITGAASLPAVSAPFTTSGGTLLFFFSASGYRANAGLITFAFEISECGGAGGVTEVYTSEPINHEATVTAVEVATCPAGQRTVTVTKGADTLVDLNDRIRVTVFEFPQP